MFDAYLVKVGYLIMCVCQVESLTAARSAAQAGTEPSDAIRVVNSVLTQLDQIKRSVSLHLFCTAHFHLQRRASDQSHSFLNALSCF